MREIGTPDAIAQLREIARSASAAVSRREALLALATINLTRVLPEIIAELTTVTDEGHVTALWRGLLPLRGAGDKLTAEFSQRPPSREAARIGVAAVREFGQHPPLLDVLMRTAGFTLTGKLSPAELQQLARDAIAHGNPTRGELIYRRPELACLACHAIGGVGGQVGPDLTSIGASAPADYLLESLLSPGEKIKEGYHAVQLSLRDGRDLTGMISRETAAELVVRDASSQETAIPVKDIARRAEVGSLMPAVLIDGLLPEERRDLVKFLTVLGQPGEFDAAKPNVARRWHVYAVTSTNQHLGIEPVIRGDSSLVDWLPVTTLVNGTLLKESYAAQVVPARGAVRELFVSARFQAMRGGRVTFHFSGVAKRLWLNGKLTAIAPDFSADAIDGINTLVLELDATTLPNAIKLHADNAAFLTQ